MHIIDDTSQKKGEQSLHVHGNHTTGFKLEGVVTIMNSQYKTKADSGHHSDKQACAVITSPLVPMNFTKSQKREWNKNTTFIDESLAALAPCTS